MSMKRSKARGTGSREASANDTDFFARPKVKEKTWLEATEGKSDDDFVPYAMGRTFAVGKLVMHAKFGKGVVTEVNAQRVTVLFEEGPRKLGIEQ